MSGTAERLSSAVEQIDEWVQPGGVDGCGIAVMHNGELVAERYAGSSRPGEPVSGSSLFGLASVTKPIAATGILAAMEDGLLSLDEPVGRHLPAFTAPTADGNGPAGRDAVTWRQLLCHTGGVAEDLGVRRDALPEVPGLDQLVSAHVAAPSVDPPGTIVRYSNTGYAILAGALEAATGEEFWSFTRRRVLHGAALADIVVRPTAEDLSRLATLTDAANVGTPTESYNSTWWQEMAVPWGGAYGTPRAVVRFADAFLRPGSAAIDLAWASRREMTRDQTAGLPGGVGSGRVWWEQAPWGLGWEVKGSKRRHWTGELTSPATFGHFGQAGTLVWADPHLDLAVAVFTNRSVARMWAFILSRWLRLSNALAAAV